MGGLGSHDNRGWEAPVIVTIEDGGAKAHKLERLGLGVVVTGLRAHFDRGGAWGSRSLMSVGVLGRGWWRCKDFDGDGWG